MKTSVRIILTVVATLVVVGVTTFAAGRPLLRRTDEDRAVIDERRAQLVKLQRMGKCIQDVQQEIRRLEATLGFFDSRLPEQKQVDVVLREVWTIAADQALATRSVRLKPAESQTRCNAQPINIILEGPFQGFYEFLMAVERLPRITKVRHFDITKLPTKEGAVQVDLTMDIFFEKKP